MTQESAGMNRRAFLQLLGCGGCALALPGVAGCTIAELYESGGGELAFSVAEPRFSALGAVDGVATADVAGRPLILIRTGEDTIVALNRLCTHVQCDMGPTQSGRWDGEKLICTCHDSHFDAAGKVLKGPATRDLAAYPVTFDPGTGEGRVVVGSTPEPEPEDPTPEEFRDLVNPYADDDADALARGQEIWSAQCATCHGAQGESVAGFPEPVPTAFQSGTSGYSDGYLLWRLRTGAATGPENSIMPAYSAQDLSDDDAWKVITYLRSLGP